MSQINILENKNNIIGADEVGYGCLAGSLVVCGVKAPKDWVLAGLNDSKKLSAKKREALREQLLKLSSDKIINYHMAERSNIEIDKQGVAVALKSAYVEVFHKLYEPDSLIIIDGILNFKGLGIDSYDHISVIKADSKYPSVMAASILAKTYRDEKMKELHKLHPNYGWENNVGYGSRDHLEAIAKYGPCELHRFSYAPMKNMKIEDPRQLNLFK